METNAPLPELLSSYKDPRIILLLKILNEELEKETEKSNTTTPHSCKTVSDLYACETNHRVMEWLSPNQITYIQKLSRAR